MIGKRTEEILKFVDGVELEKSKTFISSIWKKRQEIIKDLENMNN